LLELIESYGGCRCGLEAAPWMEDIEEIALAALCWVEHSVTRKFLDYVYVYVQITFTFWIEIESEQKRQSEN